MNAAATRALAIAEKGERDVYSRRVQNAVLALVDAVWSTPDQEGRVDAWKGAQGVLGPAASYDFQVRP